MGRLYILGAWDLDKIEERVQHREVVLARLWVFTWCRCGRMLQTPDSLSLELTGLRSVTGLVMG